MKKNVLSYLLSIIFLLLSSQVLAPVKYSWEPAIGSTQIGFSLKNQSDYLIQFQIYNESAGAYHRHVFEIAPNDEYGINLNINIQTTLKIYYCPDTTLPGSCSELNLPIANIIETNFPSGKTIYITWDGKELLPQNEGPLPYTTASGYYLTNNMQKSDYRLTEIKSGNILYPREAGRDPWEIFPNAYRYNMTLRVAETYTDATLSKLVLGLGGTPTDGEINQSWQAISAQWNPDDHQDEPNFARAVMRIINRSRDNLFNSVIKPDQ